MFKLLLGVIIAIVLFSDIASSESPSRLIQSWSELDLPFYGNLITPVTPESSRYHTIRFVGRLKRTNVFNINLVSGNDWNIDDVPLHVRIDPDNHQLMTSKNIWESGTDKVWGPDVYTNLTLAAGAEFDIEIIVKHAHFVISVNGEVIQRRVHALPPSAISYVHVFCYDDEKVHLESVSREYPL